MKRWWINIKWKVMLWKANRQINKLLKELKNAKH